MATSEAPKMIGAPVKRKEDPRLISGAGKYTDDVQLRGMPYMAVLRSQHAHARIIRVDTSRATQHPDVLAVLTGEDVARRCKSPLPLVSVREGIKAKTRMPIVADKARYVGEPMAAVVATSREAACDALELIDVEYDVLPAVVDLEKAAHNDSTLVHEDLGTNLCADFSGSVGDPDGAFDQADGVITARFAEPRVVVNPMEPRAVVANYERGSGNLTLWDTTQAPHMERDVIAEVLGLPENKVRVIAFDVGGGFGCKHPTYPEAYIAALMSMQIGRPVKWVEERQEHFMCTDHGRGQVQHVEAAYKIDGTLLATRVRFYTDLGAYCHGSNHSVAATNTPTVAPGMYRLRNTEWTTYGVYTNKVPYGPYGGMARRSPPT